MPAETMASPKRTPHPGPTTGDPLYEVVNGEYRELPPSDAYSISLASKLLANLNIFNAERPVGTAYAEMLFLLDADADIQRRPDVAFVSFERWPQDRAIPHTDWWDVVPDLAVEVTSSDTTWDEIITKVHDYFRAGVKRVWLVFAAAEQIYIYSSQSRIRILTRSDNLEDADILPGFSLPLAKLFRSKPE